MWQVERKLLVCTWRGKLGLRFRSGKGEVTSSKQWILASLKGSCKVHAERWAKVVQEDAECDEGRIRKEGWELFISVFFFVLLSVKDRILLLSKHCKRKQKHDAEARGEKVPQSRDSHSVHTLITVGIFLLGQREEGWWRRNVEQMSYFWKTEKRTEKEGLSGEKQGDATRQEAQWKTKEAPHSAQSYLSEGLIHLWLC